MTEVVADQAPAERSEGAIQHLQTVLLRRLESSAAPRAGQEQAAAEPQRFGSIGMGVAHAHRRLHQPHAVELAEEEREDEWDGAGM